LTSTVSDLFTDFISLIYPRYCLACRDGLVKGEEIVCTRCILELPRTGYHLEQENPVYKRLFGRLPIKYGVAFLIFQKGGHVQQLLHEFKYNNHPEIGRVIGRVYGDELQKCGFSDEFDNILPIPLHPVKQRRRGYNQSEEFAKGLSESLKVPVLPDQVKRITVTETQTRKSKLRRWENVREVFSIDAKEAIHNKRILLVDDVITTGATLEACGQILLDAGCSQLSVAGMAYAHE
jgi:ComF family protein